MIQVTKHRKLLFLLAAAIVVAMLLIDLSPFGGNIKFYTTWANCGVKPVQLQSWAGIAWYEPSPAYPQLLRNQSWHCTPLDAEKAGYSATRNYYSAPELKKRYGNDY